MVLEVKRKIELNEAYLKYSKCQTEYLILILFL